MESIGQLPANLANLAPKEQADFQRAYEALGEHARLAASLKKQHQAHVIFRSWRYTHMVLVPLALVIITYHGIAELLINVLYVLPK